VSKVTVSRWENGEALPHPIYCGKLCEVLELGLEELFPEEPKRSHTDKIQIIASIIPTQVNGLRQARRQHGLSQIELAKAVCTTRGSINRWEHGLGSPNLPHLRKLCQVLEALPEELFPDTISKPSSSMLEEAKEAETHLPTFRSSEQRFFDY
jgi:transcriptional regulator with XRE-family HTH domain